MERVGVMFVSVCFLASAALSSSNKALFLFISGDFNVSLNAATVKVGDEVSVTCLAPAPDEDCRDEPKWCLTFPKEECIKESDACSRSCYSIEELTENSCTCLAQKFTTSNLGTGPYNGNNYKAYVLSFNVTRDPNFDGMLISCRWNCPSIGIGDDLYSKSFVLSLVPQQDVPCPSAPPNITTAVPGTDNRSEVTTSNPDPCPTLTLPNTNGTACEVTNIPIETVVVTTILSFIICVLIAAIVVLLLVIKSLRIKLPTVSLDILGDRPPGSPPYEPNSPPKQSIYNSESATSFMY